MKKLAFKITVAVLMLAGSGCLKKIDEAYLNPNASSRVPVETLLPGIIGNMTGNASAAGNGYGPASDAIHIGKYIQYWHTNVVGNTYDQMGGNINSDILGNVWAMHYYGQGQNLNKMVEWAMEEEKWDYVGVGLAIRAWSWLLLTETHGEAIMTEAFRTNQLVFRYNTQQEIIDTARTIAREALKFLSRNDGQVSQANLAKGDVALFNGDLRKWQKFTYAVLARSYHHLSNKAEYKTNYVDSVIKFANLSLQSNGDNAMMKYTHTGIAGTANFYGPFRNNVGTLRQSEYIANLVNGLNSRFLNVTDPRAWYLLRPNLNNTIRGIKPNKGASGLDVKDQPENFWGNKFSESIAPSQDVARFIFRNVAPFPILTASEIKFMLAEAYFHKGLKAEAHQAYRDGISLHIDMLVNDYSVNIDNDKKITPAIKAGFLANPIIVPAVAELTLSHIMMQKFIALYGYGVHETWLDMRRFHFTDADPSGNGQVYADFSPPSGTDLNVNNNGKFVYRSRPRYNSEYLYNVDELKRIGAMDADYHTREPWFLQK